MAELSEDPKAEQTPMPVEAANDEDDEATLDQGADGSELKGDPERRVTSDDDHAAILNQATNNSDLKDPERHVTNDDDGEASLNQVAVGADVDTPQLHVTNDEHKEATLDQVTDSSNLNNPEPRVSTDEHIKAGVDQVTDGSDMNNTERHATNEGDDKAIIDQATDDSVLNEPQSHVADDEDKEGALDQVAEGTDLETPERLVTNNDVDDKATLEQVTDGSDLNTPASHVANDDVDNEASLDQITDYSDLKNPERRIWVVTTAALPWRTGTAVNALLRALYLTRGRPKHYVTLVIPWIEDTVAFSKLCGHSFSTQKEQEEWIRNYARERAQCAQEEEALNIMFYRAVYNGTFGSIFPLEDICGLIPSAEADVAILEEPEHLNWFRVPAPYQINDSPSSAAVEASPMVADAESGGEEKVAIDADGNHNNTNDKVDKTHTAGTAEDSYQLQRDKEELGWAHKFRHVVGVLHTNYSAYMKQYAVGTSLVAAPAITILSSIVTKAYCHKVIRLSAVLPSLAPDKEVTCNANGVRTEFINTGPGQKQDTTSTEQTKEESYASVYFIGKIIWAKGFDKLLQIQDLYRKATGSFFPMDIYGSGADEKAISRAFFGRRGPQQNDRSSSQTASEYSISSVDARAAEIFDEPISLRNRLEMPDQPGIEVMPDAESPVRNAVQIIDRAVVDSRQVTNTENPLTILGDLSARSLGTAFSTSQAVYKLADLMVCNGLSMTLTWDDDDEEERALSRASSFIFDPPQSLHEWRRNPIPARFLGVKDHVLLRDIPDHKIFLNPSVTEVLCTTTAEALAMGKFAIIPKHPSNEFFLQFPNCLAYSTPEECVEKLQWALSHEPEPPTEEFARRFTWEAATERLIEASGITRREMMERKKNGMDQADARIARLHVECGKRGQLIGRFFSGDSFSADNREASVEQREATPATA